MKKKLTAIVLAVFMAFTFAMTGCQEGVSKPSLTGLTLSYEVGEEVTKATLLSTFDGDWSVTDAEFAKLDMETEGEYSLTLTNGRATVDVKVKVVPAKPGYPVIWQGDFNTEIEVGSDFNLSSFIQTNLSAVSPVDTESKFTIKANPQDVMAFDVSVIDTYEVELVAMNADGETLQFNNEDVSKVLTIDVTAKAPMYVLEVPKNNGDTGPWGNKTVLPVGKEDASYYEGIVGTSGRFLPILSENYIDIGHMTPRDVMVGGEVVETDYDDSIWFDQTVENEFGAVLYYNSSSETKLVTHLGGFGVMALFDNTGKMVLGAETVNPAKVVDILNPVRASSSATTSEIYGYTFTVKDATGATQFAKNVPVPAGGFMIALSAGGSDESNAIYANADQNAVQFMLKNVIGEWGIVARLGLNTTINYTQADPVVKTTNSIFMQEAGATTQTAKTVEEVKAELVKGVDIKQLPKDYFGYFTVWTAEQIELAFTNGEAGAVAYPNIVINEEITEFDMTTAGSEQVYTYTLTWAEGKAIVFSKAIQCAEANNYLAYDDVVFKMDPNKVAINKKAGSVTEWLSILDADYWNNSIIATEVEGVTTYSLDTTRVNQMGWGTAFIVNADGTFSSGYNWSSVINDANPVGVSATGIAQLTDYLAINNIRLENGQYLLLCPQGGVGNALRTFGASFIDANKNTAPGATQTLRKQLSFKFGSLAVGM